MVESSPNPKLEKPTAVTSLQIKVTTPPERPIQPNIEYRIRTSLRQLEDHGVLNAMRSLSGHIRNKHPYFEIGFDPQGNSSVSAYFNPQEIPLNHSHQHLWKSQGVRITLHQTGRAEVLYRVAGTIGPGKPTGYESGWEKIDAEITDVEVLKNTAKLAKSRSHLTYDLREGDKVEKLAGKPEPTKNSFEIRFDKKHLVEVVV